MAVFAIGAFYLLFSRLRARKAVFKGSKKLQGTNKAD